MKKITCTKSGHAAAGLTWRDGVCYMEDSQLSPEQLAELVADPWITVEDVPDPPPLLDFHALDPVPAEPAPRKTKPAPAEPAAPASSEEAA